MLTRSLAILSFFWIFSLNAHVIPSAGIVERELEQEYEGRPLTSFERMPSVQIDIPEQKLIFCEGQKVLIKNIKICGNTCFTEETIVGWLEDCLEDPLSIGGIYELCQLVDQHYAEKGFFFTRAYPPPQTVEEGVLLIEVIEGKLGTIKVIENHYYSKEFIESYFACLQNQPLQYDRFLRALLLLNENCDLFVSAVFEKGEEFETCDVILTVNDGYPAHLYLNGNNFGRNLTTNTRVGARLDWGNFFYEGDFFSLAEVVGFPIDALYFTDLNYIIPINRNGAYLELDYLSSRFNIEELKSLHLSGRADIATIGLDHALIRARNFSLDLFSYFDYKQIQNFVFSHRSSFDKLRVLSLGFNIDHLSTCNARDYLTFRLGLGIPRFLGGLKTVDSNCSRQGAGGRFVVANLDYNRLQLLPKDCFFYFHASGQWSPYKLALPELIYLGGENTVRGYPLAVALGDSGYYVNAEFRFPPPFLADKNFFSSDATWKDIIQFDVFVDHGGTFLHSIDHKYLTGTGFGVRINGPYSLDIGIDAGFPLTDRRLSHEVFVYIKVTAQPF